MQQDPFWEFERTGWKRAAAHYEDSWLGATTAFVESLLDAVGVAAGTRLLDVATGPGYVAAEALRRDSVVVGLDVAEEMVELARERCPEAEFVVGDAHELPFEDERFDAVTMSFGIHHVSDPERVFAEAARVLRPGGWYAFTSWTDAPDHAPIAIADSAVTPYADTDVDLPAGPEFLRFSDRATCEQVLPEQGFDADSVRFDTVRSSWRLPNPGHLFDAQLNGGVRLAALLRAQTPERLEKIRAAMTAVTRTYETTDGSCVLPIAAHVVSAMKPRR
jgi:ubiquinone/menaquinone biosynthesis C-methylase UbiE